jgi:hypothetical protein
MINALSANTIEVAMPLGLYTSREVSAPRLVFERGIIGLLTLNTFLDPTACAPGSSGSPAALNTSFNTLTSGVLSQ